MRSRPRRSLETAVDSAVDDVVLRGRLDDRSVRAVLPGAEPGHGRGGGAGALPAARRARADLKPTRWRRAAARPSGSTVKIRRSSTTDVAAEITLAQRRADRRRAQPVCQRGGHAAAARRRHQRGRHGAVDLVAARGRDRRLRDVPARSPTRNAAPAVVTATYRARGRRARGEVLHARGQQPADGERGAGRRRRSPARRWRCTSDGDDTPIVAERTKWWGAERRVGRQRQRRRLAEARRAGCWPRASRAARVRRRRRWWCSTRATATDVTVTLLFEDGPEVSATFPGGGQRPVRRAGGAGVPDGGRPPLLGARRSRRSERGDPGGRSRDLLARRGLDAHGRRRRRRHAVAIKSAVSLAAVALSNRRGSLWSVRCYSPR